MSTEPQSHKAEELALAEFTAWAEKHRDVLIVGRRFGLRFGASNAVVDYVAAHCESPSVGKVIAANLVPIAD